MDKHFIIVKKQLVYDNDIAEINLENTSIPSPVEGYDVGEMFKYETNGTVLFIYYKLIPAGIPSIS